MNRPIYTSKKQETAILIGLIDKYQNEEQIREYLDELEFLAATAGAKTVGRFTQKLEKPDPKTFLGSGKIQEVKEYVNTHAIDMVIFDDELTSDQLKNIDKILNPSADQKGCKILDRTNLILDIFAGRARTASAKTQVELAQCQYLLPRLTRMWTHLERQKGGIGLRGPGETEIETDRRIIRNKIARLKDELKTIDKQKTTQRKNRGNLVRVALVGYTNTGKSTIMNLLSKSDVFAEDKLFATLDTTIRKVVIGNLPFLLSDTVGFIRKLPHLLVESFKSTLDEVREADMLVHIVDISHPGFEEQIKVVNETLLEINVVDKPTLLVFNQIDKLNGNDPDTLRYGAGIDQNPEGLNYCLNDLKKSWMSNITITPFNKGRVGVVFISATRRENIDELRESLYEKAKELHIKRYPYNNLLY